MIKLKCKLILLLVIGLNISLLASEPVITKEFTREVHENFDVTPDVKLSVQNKYGNIKIHTWEKNQVQIDVLIKVKSSNEEKARQFLNDVEINIKSSSSSVEAKTIYPDNNKSWWSGWFGNSNNLDYEVHYDIYAPIEMNTVLENKYGNITHESIQGYSTVVNKYGDIFYADVSGELNLDLGYGKATLGQMADAHVQIKYGSLKVSKINDLVITSKYSDIKINSCKHITSTTKYDEYTIDNVTTLKNEGKYDDFEIGSIDNINIETKYTDLRIRSLKQVGKFETGYGNVSIQSTETQLEKISIDAKYTSYSLVINNDFHLSFDGSRTELKIDVPHEEYNSVREGNDLKVKAFRGSRQGGADITAFMKYGNLKIN